MKVAVVGSGISGLASALVLARAGVRVVVYEKDGHLGGHSHTAVVDGVPMDIGFITFNQVTYPNMVQFMEDLGIEMEVSDMSFSVSLDGGKGYEWGSNGLAGMFAQKSNIINPKYWKMVYEITKFKDDVIKYLDEREKNNDIDWNESLGSFVKSHGYSQLFQDAYLIPVCCSIWSCYAEDVMNFSAFFLLKCFHINHLLQLFGRPQWLTLKHRTQSYINKITQELESRGCQVITGCEIKSVTGHSEGCTVVTADNSEEKYDACIVTAHAPAALAMLGDEATYEERRILGAYRYVVSDIYLHSDKSLMPQNPSAWSAWNYLGNTDRGVCLTYWINLLQNLDSTSPPYFVTLNPPTTPKNTVLKYTTGHPVPSIAASKANVDIHKIQGKRSIWFCGAYQGYGFHEDGVKTGLSSAYSILGKDYSPLKNRTHMVPSLMESGARLMVTRFLRHYIVTGSLTLTSPPTQHMLEALNMYRESNRCLNARTSEWQTLIQVISITYLENLFNLGIYSSVVPLFVAYCVTGENRLLEEGSTIFCFEGTNTKCSMKSVLKVHSPLFYWKVATEADIGLADAYINGYFSFVNEQDGLLNLLLLLIANRDLNNGSGKKLSRRGWWTPLILTAGVGSARYFLHHLSRKNTLEQAQRNVSLHYDLSNEFFSLFLDETMTYSSAIFKSENEDLKTAQLRKISILINKARIDGKHHILEIGSGWGSLAIEVVKQTGCKYTGITLSKEQLNFAQRRVKEAGLEDNINFLLCDYRQLPSSCKYDRIISCEMLEQVGHEYFEEFFGCCDSLLAKDGLIVLQFISIPEERYDEHRRSSDFIKEFIFPGGCLPSLLRITSAMSASSRFCMENVENIGIHYVETLLRWQDNFMSKRSEILALGFDEKFIRTWEYYFMYCAAGFKSCTLGNYQVVLSRPGNVEALGLLYKSQPSAFF